MCVYTLYHPYKVYNTPRARGLGEYKYVIVQCGLQKVYTWTPVSLLLKFVGLQVRVSCPHISEE